MKNNTLLEKLHCQRNKITSLDLSNNICLKEIVIDDNVTLNGVPEGATVIPNSKLSDYFDED